MVRSDIYAMWLNEVDLKFKLYSVDWLDLVRVFRSYVVVFDFLFQVFSIKIGRSDLIDIKHFWLENTFCLSERWFKLCMS